MCWRIGTCLLATAVASCAGGQQPAGSLRDPAHRLASAIPYDAKIAFLFDKPWAKAAAQREVAARLGIAKQYGAVMLVVRGTLGFDPMDPAEVRTHGFDDQGGIAVFVLPGKSSPIFVVGIADPERAQQTVHRVFEDIEQRQTGGKPVFETRAAGAGGVTVVRRARGGVQAAYLVHGGFLYLRLAGPDDPAQDLSSIFALEPGQGLERAHGYSALAGSLAPADVLFYISELSAQQSWLPGVRVAGGAAVGFDVQPDRLGLRVRALREPDPDGGAPQPAPAARVDLAAGLPADATLWVHVTCSPALVWSELSKHLPDARRLAERALGEDAGQEVRSSFTGNFAMAMYPSVARLRGSAGGGSQDSAGLLVVAELAESRDSVIEAILDRGTENLSRKSPIAVQRRVASGMPLWRIAGEAIVAIHEHRLLAVVPTRPSGNAPGARDEARPPSNAAPPRWPPEATTSELGVFAEVLRSGRSPLREELRKLHADEDTRPADLFVRASGAVLDFPALVRSLRVSIGSQGAPLDAVNQFFGHVLSAPFHKARFEWALARDAVQAELQWELPEKTVAAEAAPAVPPANRLQDTLNEARRVVQAANNLAWPK